MITPKHFVLAIALLAGTTLSANNDPVVKDKTSTSCEEFYKCQKKTECLTGTLEQTDTTDDEIGDFGYVDIEEMELLSQEMATLGFEEVSSDNEKIGDFGYVDFEEMELLSQEMVALGFEEVGSDNEKIGDFGYVDFEEMELLREEMGALGFEL